MSSGMLALEIYYTGRFVKQGKEFVVEEGYDYMDSWRTLILIEE